LRTHSLVVYLFFYAPIVVLTAYSFNKSPIVGKWTGLTLSWYGDFLDHDNIQESIWISVKVCVASTLISVVLAHSQHCPSSDSGGGDRRPSTRFSICRSSSPTSRWL
jgi:ABC-type spermidine/putrescine transport system permease subunit II